MKSLVLLETNKTVIVITSMNINYMNNNQYEVNYNKYNSSINASQGFRILANPIICSIYDIHLKL